MVADIRMTNLLLHNFWTNSKAESKELGMLSVSLERQKKENHT